ncbi:unnamed protein product [Urochloa decumbens]|uniref:DUF4220 domain-containing protein n=1 Tax=Urochloa decumbens TaxID=240449 RepID=A0ABC9HAA4_9POAL
MILVGIGSYGQRYRHHPFTRFIFLGATTLFLPIISSVISTVGSFPEYVITSPNYNVEFIEDQSAELSALVAICNAFTHSFSIIVWAFLVQIVMINTSTIVSVDDRKGQSKAPPPLTSCFFRGSGPFTLASVSSGSRIKVPAAVKVCIINALRSSFNGGLSNGLASLRQSQVGDSFLWACNGKGTSDIRLIWHIATCITEVKHPYRHNQEQDSAPVSNSDHKVAATHLSRYCAYLVSWCPELLPDNIAWSKSLYEAVKKDARRALASHHAAIGSSMPKDECKKLIELLSENSKHEVLKNGVKLGKQLVETIDDEETAWKLLADFWSEMILYVTPSDNLKGHKEAIARGGELITLLWAMLFHAGIVSRPGEEDGAASTSAGAV